MDYENAIYFIAPSQNFHPLGLLKINIQRNYFFPNIVLHATSTNF
jgi:hypothetical protein